MLFEGFGVSFYEDVLKFDVPMDDLTLVQAFKAFDYIVADLCFAVLGDIFEHFLQAPVAELHHNPATVGILIGKVWADFDSVLALCFYHVFASLKTYSSLRLTS